MAGNGTPAGRLSIEIIADVARITKDLDAIKRVVKASSGDIAASARHANDNLSNISGGMAKMAPSAKMAAFGMRNLAFQTQDLGVQFAMAANSSQPLRGAMMALVMQGPQIRDAFNQTGKSITGLIGGFVRAHPILTAVGVVATVAAGAFKMFAGEVDKSGELDRYANSLGLTSKEMEKLGDVGVTAGDVLKGLWRTIDQGLGASKVFAAIKGWAVDAFSTAITWIKNYAAASYAAMAGTAGAIIAMTKAAKQALTGDLAGALETVKAIPAGYSKAFADARKAMDGFFANVGRNSIAAAKERIGAEAATIIDDRAEKAMKKTAKEKGSMLGDVMSGAFLASFAAKMQTNPIAKVDWAGATDLRGRMDEIEEARLGKERLKEAEDYMDLRARDRFLQAADTVASAIGGSFGRAINDLAAALDRGFPKLASGIGSALGLGDSLGGAFSQFGAAVEINKAIGSIFGFKGGPLGIFTGMFNGMLKSVKKASATIEIMAGEAMTAAISGNSSKLKQVAGAMADGLIGGLSSIAEQLGGILGDGIRVSIGQRDKTYRVDLQGLGRTKNMPKFDTEEAAIAYAVQEVIRQGAIVGLRAGTEVLLKGEGDLEAQLQKAVRFENVFKELADRANPARASIEAITKEFNQLIDIFDEAKATTADYVQLQELMAQRQRDAIEQAFEPIRSMLDELKSKAGEAGAAVRSAYERVLSREADAVAAYEEAVQARRERAIDALQAQLSTLRDQAQGFAEAAAKLRDFSAGIFGTAGLASLRATFDRIARLAQGGDMEAMGQLAGAGQALRDAVVGGATDRISMMRELNRIRVEADKAATVADGRSSAAERQAAAIEKQITALQSVDKTTENIEQLLADMQTAKAAADAAREQMKAYTELAEVEQGFSDAVAAYEAAKASRDDLMRQITTAGFADLIEAQKKTGDQLIAALSEVAITAQLARTQAADAIAKAQAAAAAAVRAANDNMPWLNWLNGVPGFADGGNHRGGLRVVGEEGPELEYTGASRIFSADEIARAMLGGPDASEIGRAVAEHLRPTLYQIAKNTGKSLDIQRKWDADGTPEERDVA